MLPSNKGQKGYNYEKTNAIPVVVIDESKKKTFKTGYIHFIPNFLLLQAPYLKVCDSISTTLRRQL